MKNHTLLLIIASLIFIGVTLSIVNMFVDKKPSDSEIVYMIQSVNWNEGDAVSKYRKMMIRILSAYSYKNDSKYRKSMSKDTKIKYINFHWKASDLIGISEYIVPQIHKQETAYNPNLDHEYGETGLGGMKFETAIFANALLRFMPGNLRRFFHFDIKTKADLKDPILNSKCTYILLWWNMRIYGREDWAVLIYRWGGFLGRHWNNGTGDVPDSFTLNGIKYNAYKYYFELASYVDAYERGLLEPNKAIEEKWIDYYKKKCREEITYRNMRSKNKTLMKKLREKDELHKMVEDKYDEIDQASDDLNKLLIETGKVAKNKGWKHEYKKLISGVKDYIKKWDLIK